MGAELVRERKDGGEGEGREELVGAELVRERKDRGEGEGEGGVGGGRVS